MARRSIRRLTVKQARTLLELTAKLAELDQKEMGDPEFLKRPEFWSAHFVASYLNTLAFQALYAVGKVRQNPGTRRPVLDALARHLNRRPTSQDILSRLEQAGQVGQQIADAVRQDLGEVRSEPEK
jgi:hypothetical protein